MHNPFRVVEMFEENLCEYTGAKYCVCVNSCTAALELALRWWRRQNPFDGWVDIPEKTYTSVPMAAHRAGYEVTWTKEEWKGEYQIKPTNVWDSAKRFTGGMYRRDQFQCVSFHPQKPLAISVGGGAILHGDREADGWFRRMRFDGRTEGVPTAKDIYEEAGLHCYMFPSTAAEGLHKLAIYARQYDHEDMPSELENYPGPENHKWLS